jgi:hypothetical protein
VLSAPSFPVVHRASVPPVGCLTGLEIDFAEECAEYGYPLNVPTVTLSGTVVPSAGNSPTDSATTGSPQDPPTGIPSNFFSTAAGTSDSNPSAGDFGGPTTTSPKVSQKGPTSSATGSPGGKSDAVRVGKKAEVICVLFSVCLTAVLMAS